MKVASLQLVVGSHGALATNPEPRTTNHKAPATNPELRATSYAPRAPMMMRNLRAVLGIALTLLLGVMLIATIYFTLFDLQWIAFLSGVLFAAIAATTTQSSKSQWITVRRTRQWQRAKDALAVQNARLAHTAEALKAVEARFRLIANALPAMIVYVDNEDYCRYYNRAFAQWCGSSEQPADGVLAREVLGDGIYGELKKHRAQVLAGREIRVEAEWRRPGGARESCDIMLLPYPPGAEQPAGCYVLITGMAIDAARSGELITAEPAPEQRGVEDEPRRQLMRALQEDQFMLYAQTIRPLTGTVPYPRCFEVLLRLKDENQGALPPGGFFPVAERCNLMGEIDRWVVRNLIKWCADKQDGEPAWRPPLYCVNLAASSLRDPGFAPYVSGELERSGFPAANLCFEIAEPDVTGYPADVRKLMNTLRPLGCRFTVQSFGKAEEAFAPLKDLQFDFLKIDGTLIHNMLTDPEEFRKIRVIAKASQRFGLRTIAEFVESDDTLEKLREAGVDYAQGFGIGRPSPIAQVS